MSFLIFLALAALGIYALIASLVSCGGKKQATPRFQ